MLQPGSVSVSEPTDSNMVEPQGCLNMPSGRSLSHCLNGWKWVVPLQVLFLHNANQFQGLFEQPSLHLTRTTFFSEQHKFSTRFLLWRLSNTLPNSCALVVEGVCVRARRLTCLSLWVTGEVGGRSGAQQLASHLHIRTRTSIGDHHAPSLLR